MKYTKEFKLEMLKKRKNGENTYKYAKCSKGCWIHAIRRWERIYEQLGEAGLEHNKPKISINEKLDLIHRIENGESMTSVALSTGRQCGLVHKWYKIYRQYGVDGLKSLKVGRKKKMRKPSNDKNKSELERLKEENEYLKAENEYLKKLRALIQKEEKDQPPDRK